MNTFLPGLQRSLISLSAGTLLFPLPSLAQNTPMPPAVLPIAAATAPSRLPVAGSPAANYLLGSGDVVDIKVFDYPEYTGEQVILPDGTITLPLIGRIDAGQRTAAQLTEDLTVKLKRYLKNPVVTIGLNKLRPLRVTVSGEVQRPGPMQLQSIAPINNGNNPQVLMATLSEALQQAGGITQTADIRNVVLRRTHANGSFTEQTLDLWQALRSPQTNSDPMLMDGDAIHIPTAVGGNDADRRLASKASFSPKSVKVRVVGEVKRPGEVEVTPDANLSSAIAIAGGPTEKAKMNKVVFVRMNDQGQVDRQEVDLKNLTDTYQVKDGDVLMVPKNNGREFLDVASQALGPFGFLFNLFR